MGECEAAATLRRLEPQMELGGGAGRAAFRWGLPLPGLPDVFQSLALDDFDKPPAHGGLLAEPQSVPCATRGKKNAI